MNPLAVAASFNQSGSTKICQVAGDFWLVRTDHGNQKADADLATGHQTQQPQASTVGQGPKEQLHIEFLCVFVHSKKFSHDH